MRSLLSPSRARQSAAVSGAYLTRLGGLVCLLLVGITALTGFAPSGAFATACPNEQLRAEQGDQHLPDCRAYELVTPSEKSSTQDLTFENGPYVAVAPSGERVAFKSFSFLGSNPSPQGTSAVIARTPSSGWQTQSVQPPSAGETTYNFNIVNPELTVLGLVGTISPTFFNFSPEANFVVGPAGGPYTKVASAAYDGFGAPNPTMLGAASADFTHVVLSSPDHSLLAGAAGTEENATVLYEWSKATEQLQLVNVTTAGALTSTCGAMLGGGLYHVEGFQGTPNVVSNDGSKIFFTSPDGEPAIGGSSVASCNEPERIYMRLSSDETVEVSAPETGVSDPTGYHSAFYQGATEDGSKVWFISTTELTADDTGHAMELYEYDTTTRKLVRVSRGETGDAEGGVHVNQGEPVVVSEDGSTVYFLAHGQLAANAPSTSGGGVNIYRYDTGTGSTTYVATALPNVYNPLFTNRTGSALVFEAGQGGEVTGPAGFHSNEGADEIFRYEQADKSLKCVSCPPPGTPANGAGFFTNHLTATLAFKNDVDQSRPISEDGRHVFFNSNDDLVPQDTNGSGGGNMMTRWTDTYEWEANGAGSCVKAEGCLSLLSSGTSDFPAVFLGASADGSNVFIGTNSALVPQDPDTLGDIYDVRVNGGFAAASPAAACVGESCRLIGGAAPVFGTPQSEAFSGAGNPVAVPLAKKVKVKKAKKKTKKAKRRARKRVRKGRKASRGSVGARKANGRGR